MPQPTLRPAHEPPAQIVRVPRQRQSYDDARPDDVRHARSRRALLVPAVLCGVVTVGAAGALGAVALGQPQHSTHTLRPVDSAGGLVRESADGGLSDRAASGLKRQFSGRLDRLVTATYRNDDVASDRPAGQVVFIGATIRTDGDPADFVREFRSAARTSSYQVTEVDAGTGARGVCASTSAGAGTCAWSTGDSIGELAPTGYGWSVDRLAAAMRTLRAATESR